MTSLCWPASLSRFPSSSFHTARSWLFQQVLKMLPCGIVKKLIRLICGECSCWGEEGPGAICGSAVCLVGCDEWVERILAGKATQGPTCWGSTPAADTGRHPPSGYCLIKGWWWCQPGRLWHPDTHWWRQIDPNSTLHHSCCMKAVTRRGCEPVNKPKKCYFMAQ